MDQIRSTIDWVGEYLEWTQPGGWTLGLGSPAPGGIGTASADVGEEFVTSYLDWMDSAQPMGAARSPYRATGSGRDSRGGAGGMAGLDVFNDALLAALRTESDCLQFLQRILYAGEAPPRMVKFASKALKHAERLLEDERCAWRTLAALHTRDLPSSRVAWETGSETDWPHALEELAADIHALKGTVLAERRH